LSAKKPITETSIDFITRKYLEYRQILDEALEAGALMTPTKTEQMSKDLKGGMMSTIQITFTISELSLHDFRQRKKKI